MRITLPMFLSLSDKMRMDVRCNRCVDNYRERAIKILSSVKAKLDQNQTGKTLFKAVAMEEKDQNLV